MLLPKPLRKFLAIFRGDVSPVLILLSAMLGFWFGLTPGWYGVHVVLLVLALVLNVNFGIFILLAGLGRAVCYAAAPLLYVVGQWVHASLEPLLAFLGGLPIVGLTDFARLAVAGGTVAGPIAGLLLGLALARLVSLFRKGWLTLDERSEAFRNWQNKAWVRWLDWLLLGKRTDDVRKALAARTRIVRPAGVAVAAVILIVAGVGLYFAQGDRLGPVVADQLTRLNGAEVNLSGFDLAPFAGRVAARDVALTDPNEPRQNRLVIGTLTADAGLLGLLRGRLVVDDVELGQVAFDQPRATPGRVLPREEQKPAATFDPAALDLPKMELAELREFFKRGQELDRQLADLADWLPEREPEPPVPPAQPQAYLEYLTARAAVAPTPFVVIRQATLLDVALPFEALGRSNIRCENLSDAPRAAGWPVTVAVQSQVRPAELTLTSHYERPEGGATLLGRLEEVDLATLQQKLSPRNPVRFAGGTAAVSVSGDVSREFVDIWLDVRVSDLRAEATGRPLFDLDPKITGDVLKAIENLTTRLRIVGPTRSPRLVFDVDGLKEEFKDALVRAGKNELVGRLDQLLKDEVPVETPAAEQLVDDPLGAGKSALEGLLGGKKRKQDKKDEDKP